MTLCAVLLGLVCLAVLGLYVSMWWFGPIMPHRRKRKPRPAVGTRYYFENGAGRLVQDIWSDSDIDRRRFAARNVFIPPPDE